MTTVTRTVTVELQQVRWARTLGGAAAKALLPKSMRRAFSGKTDDVEGECRSSESVTVRFEASKGDTARVVPRGACCDVSTQRTMSGTADGSTSPLGSAMFHGCTLVVEATGKDGRKALGRLSVDDPVIDGRAAATTRTVTLMSATGDVLGSAVLSTLLSDATSVKTVAPTRAESSAAAAAAAKVAAARARQRVLTEDADDWRSAVQENAVYDAALEAGLRAIGFGKRRLSIRADWSWLLTRLTVTHGVSDAYGRLRHLLHVFGGSATPTADCLELVLALYEPVHVQAEESGLAPPEMRMLAATREGCDRLLGSVFENYKSLVEALPSGVVDGGILPFGAPCPAPALALAVRLFTLLHDPLAPDFGPRLQAHFRTATNKCYWRRAAGALENTAAMRGGVGDVASSHDSGAVREAAALPFQDSYSSLARLCQELCDELRMDIQVHDAEVLPSSFYLPGLAAEEYCRELGDKLKTFLASCPPPRPAGTILDLLDAVGDLWDRLVDWKLDGPATSSVEPVQLFGRYIRAWIADSRNALVARCKAWAVASTRTGPEGAASVAELYGAMQGVLSEYERVVSRWPLFAAELEDALAAAERTMLSAVEGWVAPVLPPQYRLRPAGSGLTMQDLMQMQQTPSKAAPATPQQQLQQAPPKAPAGLAAMFARMLGKSKAKPVAPPPPPASPVRPPRTVSDGTAMLGGLPSCLAAALVALKAMEALRSDCHARLKRWATGGGGAAAEAFGTLFLVVGQELRGKYCDYLGLAVAKVADGMRKQGASLRAVLKQLVPGADVEGALAPVLAATRDTVAGLERACGRGRAFVAVTRGLWDSQAHSVLQFLLEDCKENSSWAQRAGASAALDALATTYASVLSGEGGALGHDVREDDLKPPEHARRVADLQNLNLNTSFSMY